MAAAKVFRSKGYPAAAKLEQLRSEHFAALGQRGALLQADLRRRPRQGSADVAEEAPTRPSSREAGRSARAGAGKAALRAAASSSRKSRTRGLRLPALTP